MKIEITFVWGDSLLNIKQDTQIYFVDEDCFFPKNCHIISGRMTLVDEISTFFLFSINRGGTC